MRIAMTNNFFLPRPSGSAHHTEGLAAQLAAAGHEVLVITAAYERRAKRRIARRVPRRTSAGLDTAAVPRRDELRDPVDLLAAQLAASVPDSRRFQARPRPSGRPVLRSHVDERDLGPPAQGPDGHDRIHRARAQRSRRARSCSGSATWSSYGRSSRSAVRRSS